VSLAACPCSKRRLDAFRENAYAGGVNQSPGIAVDGDRRWERSVGEYDDVAVREEGAVDAPPRTFLDGVEEGVPASPRLLEWIADLLSRSRPRSLY
jgi:hypothetical protein